MAEKKVTMTIRVDPMEKMRIKRWAHETSQTMSEYVLEAVRERLARDEIPSDEKSDLDLVQAALRGKAKIKEGSETDAKIEEKSLTDLIQDFVNEDDTAF